MTTTTPRTTNPRQTQTEKPAGTKTTITWGGDAPALVCAI